jgi:hypothetical protein
MTASILDEVDTYEYIDSQEKIELIKERLRESLENI